MDEYLARVAEAVKRVDVGQLTNAVNLLKKIRKNGDTVWIVGNGGSAATADHFANDLIKMAHVRAIGVPSLMSAVSAYGNDNGGAWMYCHLLAELVRETDILVAISCSGKSPNVIEAASIFAPDELIVLTGNNLESTLARMPAESRICVPDDDIRVQEDTHLAICHAIVGELR